MNRYAVRCLASLSAPIPSTLTSSRAPCAMRKYCICSLYTYKVFMQINKIYIHFLLS